METPDQTIDPYVALALQLKCRAVNGACDRNEARAMMQAAVDELHPQIAAARAFIGADCRLVVLPEYWLTGFPQRESITTWAEKACLAMDDPLYESLGKIAQQQGIFLAGNAYELDPNFPGLYFQTCFVLDPSGAIVLRYRRLNSMYAPTPHDVWDAYLDCYGLEGIFPVAKTAIGNLAAVASDEILFPEVVRCLALRGAEILLHPTSEVYGDARSPKEAAKVSRAVENLVYVVSSNTAGIANTPILDASVDGGSKIIDYRGLVLTETKTGESMAAFADIDVGALRRYRRRGGVKNVLARQRLDAYVPLYREASIYPANTLAGDIPERSHFAQGQQTAIERLIEKGLI